MIKQFLLSTLVGGSLFVGGNTVRADDDDHDRHGRHGHGGHYDYTPGHYHRHGNHYDYYPGEYRYHEGSHHRSHYGSYGNAGRYGLNQYGSSRIPYGVPRTGYYGSYYNQLRPSTLGIPQYGAYGVPRPRLSIQIGR